MQRRDAIVLAIGAALVLGLLAAGVATYDDGDVEEATVVVFDGQERAATVDATVANDGQERYVGLSDHDALADDEGMLFVHGGEAERTYVMREMSFGIDVVYVDAEGCITSVNPAPEPGPDEDGADQEYPGYGKYVLEVPIGVVSEAGVEAGDPVRIEYGSETIDGRDGACAGPEDDVVLYDGDERVAAINASIARTPAERRTGLSEHESLARDRGMLFVYEESQPLTFVMREMEFAIDIVYVDSQGCVTGVHPARPPGPNEDGNDRSYPGEGQYVIEVVRGVASDAGVEAGDPVRIEYGDTVVDGTDADCFEP